MCSGDESFEERQRQPLLRRLCAEADWRQLAVVSHQHNVTAAQGEGDQDLRLADLRRLI